MTGSPRKVVIIGGGLSGLSAAFTFANTTGKPEYSRILC